jgi:hypothetical protein
VIPFFSYSKPPLWEVHEKPLLIEQAYDYGRVFKLLGEVLQKGRYYEMGMVQKLLPKVG